MDEIGDFLCGVFGEFDVLLLFVIDNMIHIINVPFFGSDDVLESVGLALEGCSQVLQLLVFDHGFMLTFVFYLLLLYFVKSF